MSPGVALGLIFVALIVGIVLLFEKREIKNK